MLFTVTNDLLINGTFDPAIIPEGTTDIDVTDCTELTSLRNITFNNYADLSYCIKITSLENVTFKGNADLSSCITLVSLNGTTFHGDANLTACTGLVSLDGATFHGDANLIGCTGLISLDNVTFTGNANFWVCTGLTALKDVIFKGNANLTGYTSLASLTNTTFNSYADLKGCTGLTSLDDVTFNSYAYLDGCTRLTSLKNVTFNGYTSLSGCTGLTSLTNVTFNDGVNLRDCTGLTSLNDVTFNGNAYLARCTGLTSLDGATFNGNVSLKNCTSLIPTPALISRLETLEAQSHIFTCPQHFNRSSLINQAKARLDTIVAAYKETDPAGAPSTTTLFHRFLSEGLGQEDGKAAVVASVTPLLDFIEKDPQHLRWIEPIAGLYLDGCVNQPVLGFSQISAWSSIAQASGIIEKMKAARQLMALDTITGCVASADPKPGAAIEAEAGNALLREVHSRLVASVGIKPWAGVPGSISYEAMIKNWLTDDVINGATAKVKETLAKPLSEVSDYLLAAHPSTWAAVAFPEEVSALRQTYADKRQALLHLLDPDTYQDETPSPSCQKEIDHYNQILAGKSDTERSATLNQLTMDVSEQQEEKQIAEEGSALTRKSAMPSFAERVRQPAGQYKGIGG